MDINEVIDSYVRDVAACLPRAKRNDVAYELRALLDEELAGRAAAAGHAPDRKMLMALLADFGRPAEAAQRYHARAPMIAAADTHHFFIWALGGAVVLVMHQQLSAPDIDLGALFLQWLGILLVFFTLADWVRRRRPDTFRWKPSRGPDWMPRSLSVLSLVAFVLFPLSMYSAPVTFAGWLLPDAVRVDGLALSAEFAASWQRFITLALLVAMALQFAVGLVLGRVPAWLRRVGVGLTLGLGVMFIAHAAPMHAFGSAASFQVFVSSHANAVAAPIFLALGGMMLLFGLYYAYQEWACIRPAPTASGNAVA